MSKEIKPNTSPFKCPMPKLDLYCRTHSFMEVSLGYDEETAIEEAKRCLNCSTKPCVKHCPIHLDIPKFIHEVALGNFEKAYEIISNKNMLPGVCGRVCNQAKLCECKCTRGIGKDKETNKLNESVAIGRLERFVADYCYMHLSTLKKPQIIKNGHKVAVIGSGPSGLACAADLAKLGYDVTVFESYLEPGGFLTYGIPDFRLRKSIVDREIMEIEKLGVRIETFTSIDKSPSIDDLFKQYNFEAVFLGIGVDGYKDLDIKGEHTRNVCPASIYLRETNIYNMFEGEIEEKPAFSDAKRLAVIGGGNVAMDVARTAVRHGAEKVYVVYRRSMDELPANKDEIEEALEEGVEFKLQLNPVEIIKSSNGNSVSKIKLEKQKLGKIDSSGRKKPISTGEYEELFVDTVIHVIGSEPDSFLLMHTPEIKTNKDGYIITTNESGLTTKKHVYAGGDVVTGSSTVVHAIAAGKKAAKAIDEELSRNN